MFCKAIAVKSRQVCGSWPFSIGETVDLCARHYNMACTKGVKLEDGSFLKLVDDRRRPCEDCGKWIKYNGNHKVHCKKKSIKENITTNYRIEYVIPSVSSREESQRSRQAL